MNDITTAFHDDGKTQRIQSSIELPKVAQWYWVKEPDTEPPKWLGCVVHVGSNFVALEGPCHEGRGRHSTRVHFNAIADQLEHEPNYKAYLDNRVKNVQSEIADLMDAIQQLTLSLGVAPAERLENLSASSGTALATLSSQSDIGAYKQALITAQKETIPEMHEAIRRHTETLANWMAAEIIPLQAQTDAGKKVIETMTDRIFNLELYAGLAERAVQFADGAPAPMEEKLRVFQRMLFCDEEALLGYESGGMDITDIGSFQHWLAKPENRDRILPYPRCLVAMRVRRDVKDRDWGGSLHQLFMNMDLAQGDMKTFLFVRNGQQLFRISTAIEFEQMIFPSLSAFDPSVPLMVKMSGRRVEQMITRSDFDDRVAKERAQRRNAEQWELENPRDQWEAAHPGCDSYEYRAANPFRKSYSYYDFCERDWEPFDSTSVYYDEALAKVSDEIKQYNRVAVIIQGLFDRSECLAPHKPVRSWTAEGFRESIELIYDGMGLLFGEPPSFEAYRQRCNALIDENSILIGQDHAWQKREAGIECRRIQNNWRTKHDTYRPKLFKPFGDHGPGYMACPSQVKKRAGKAVFTWFRERRVYNSDDPSLIRATITVPFDELFNVSAYKPGDFKIFFQDPRTRAKYLQWAPMLIAAEDYYSKGTPVQQPVD